MICEEHWKIFDQQQHAWLSQFKLINWESYFEDEMTQEEIEVAELVKRLRDELIAALLSLRGDFLGDGFVVINRKDLIAALTNTGKMK